MATTEGIGITGYLIQEHETEELTGRLRWCIRRFGSKVLEQEWRRMKFRNGVLQECVDEWREVPEVDE